MRLETTIPNIGEFLQKHRAFKQQGWCTLEITYE